jgi:hypothetical protein
VSRSPGFGNGGPYEMFAGRDATLALAKMRLDLADVNAIDTWPELDADGRASLESWAEYFDERYWRAGMLHEWSARHDFSTVQLRVLAQNSLRPGVKLAANGTQTEIVSPGHGRSLEASGHQPRHLLVELHYLGRRADGVPLPSMDSRAWEDGRPLLVDLFDLVPCWAAAMADMCEGECRRIWLPPALASAILHNGADAEVEPVASPAGGVNPIEQALLATAGDGDSGQPGAASWGSGVQSGVEASSHRNGDTRDIVVGETRGLVPRGTALEIEVELVRIVTPRH